MSKYHYLVVVALMVVTGCHSPCAVNLASLETVQCDVTTPPIGYDNFYGKYCSANGIPIMGSERVEDAAMQQAWEYVVNMLASRPDVHQRMMCNDVSVSIIAASETLRDIPAFRKFDLSFHLSDRSAPAIPKMPVAAIGEENLLCSQQDISYGQNLFVSTWGLSMVGTGVEMSFLREAKVAFDLAMDDGLWKGTWAVLGPLEYGAAGIEAYFGTADNEYATTPEALEQYDEALFMLVDKLFDTDWRPSCP